MSGWSLTVRSDEKVFRNGPYVIGFTVSFRMGQLLRYSFKPPEPQGDLMAFMVTDFVDELRKTLSKGGWATKASEHETGGTFLVGVKGRLFQVESDYQVGEAAAGALAVGCGDDVTLGALLAQPEGTPPKRRVRKALEIAEQCNGGVRGPFVVLRSGRGE